ncbi:hypothetical protein [Fructobacillus pseudoficulneus]|nr:hypothetical protein [Fructobacillus pseudoficulneus]SEH42970.1 hypothetical protein SAMN05660469_1003 [Fructobacillus pseudoficulneus]
MNEFLEIKTKVLKNQPRNHKNWIIALSFVLLIDFLLLLMILTGFQKMDFDWVLSIISFIPITYLVVRNIKLVNGVNAAVKGGALARMIDISDFDEVNQWFQQRQDSFAKSDIWHHSFTMKFTYVAWGCIESTDAYQLFIIDFSNGHELIKLTIKKDDLNNYANHAFITSLIQRIQKIAKMNQAFFRKHLYSYITFYIFH